MPNAYTNFMMGGATGSAGSPNVPMSGQQQGPYSPTPYAGPPPNSGSNSGSNGQQPVNTNDPRQFFTSIGLDPNLYSSLPSDVAQDMYNNLRQQYLAKGQGQNPNDFSTNYYKRDGSGNVWLTTPGSPSGYQYGASAPAAGIDQRAWTNVLDPNAYQYGGQPGMAESEEQRYAQMGQAASGNAAPQMNLDQYNQAVQSQQQAADILQKQATGQMPSLAEAQTQAALANANRQQAIIAGSARGGGSNLAAAQGQASQAAMQLGENAMQTGAQARIQEQLGAQQQYANMTNQIAGQQLQVAGQQAGFQAGQNQLNQQGQLAYESMRQGVFGSQMGGQMAGEAANAGAYQFGQNQNMQQQQIDNANRNALVGGILTAGGAIVGTALGGPAGGAAGAAAGGGLAHAVSDVRAKENIRPAGAAIDQTLGQMGSYQFNYNRPDLPAGNQVGTMAQQLQGTPAGSQMVGKDPQTGQLVIEGPQATNFSLAALARLNERLAALEGRAGDKEPEKMSWADLQRREQMRTPQLSDADTHPSHAYRDETPEEAEARANVMRASAFQPAPPPAAYQPGSAPYTPMRDLPIPMSYVESMPGQRR